MNLNELLRDGEKIDGMMADLGMNSESRNHYLRIWINDLAQYQNVPQALVDDLRDLMFPGPEPYNPYTW